ncbi:MAG TPA: MMPL family transporter [Nocardioides sp.]|uniref:MMPL family transporter n=1 Tax=Nocardioides sp. TaxID=35761 RepID=UPI002D80994D|nr:MMPL family transporter [Nocardioides sp.]HET6654326.1 MMPL family transporter [Nocardioides sp.]
MSTASHIRRSRRWVLPLVVVLAWLFIGGPLGSFAGQLSTVQENDNAAFLPQSAESTIAQERLTEFAGDESVPATVVFEREGGLTEDDLTLIGQYADDMREVDNVDAAGVQGPVPSEDGAAAQVVVPIATSDGEELQVAVDDLRLVLEDTPDGLTALVGGPGGVLGDFIEAFGAIDGLLLGVALLVVLFILLVVYRSPVLPFVVLFSAVLALGLASAVIYGLAKNDLLDLNGQSQGILFILAVGAATDYSLLIVARYREELRDTESKYDAMRKAYRGAFEPIVASGLTVILGLLCLLLSDLSSLQGLGPVGAIGIAGAMFASLTLLPSALVLLGRRAFWPYRPSYGSEHTDAKGIWGRVARLVGRRARAVWVTTFLLLAIAAAFVPTLDEDPVPQTELFLTQVDSVDAQEILDAHFDADQSSPVHVVTPEDQLDATLEVLRDHPGIAAEGVAPLPDVGGEGAAGVPAPRVVDGEVIVFAPLTDPAESAAATATVRDLRTDLDEVSEDVVVGGQTAILIDTRDTTSRDRAVVIPAILAVIFVVLALLLRSLLAPALLLVANVLSFGATLGISALLFKYVFDFPASDPSTSLIGFVFLVALGIDYSIFLMTRVREESIKQGTHPGVLKGLSVTGGVITSAGVVLAATFAALSVVPILFLAQIAFIVAFGVLLDTLVVRSLLVPALSYDLGPRVWWPSRLWHTPDHADPETAEMLHLGREDGVKVD